MTAQRVFFVGDPSHGEFHEPVAWLREYCDLAIFEQMDIARAELAAADDPPDVVIVAAATPGIYSQQDVAALLRLAPLAQFIGLMGGWCEGELRTGQPWQGVTRVYWHEFVPRMSVELMGVNRRGRLAMPRTFTESELSGIAVPSPENGQRGLVVIRATTLEAYDAIAEACHVIGHSTVWASPRQPAFVMGPAVAIWDVSRSIELDTLELVAFVKQVHQVPLITLIGFPRESDRQVALNCGATSVVSKPYLLQELWTELTRVTSACQTVDDRISAA
ncbi:MAG: hypothetical protein H8E66_23320 [Planctomycetes bacterium]|nr:hypothetical protein [Planctomycetota bacterium]